MLRLLSTWFLMLAGIKGICIRGKKRDIEFTQEKMADGSGLSIYLENEIVPKSSLELMNVIHSDSFDCYYSDGVITFPIKTEIDLLDAATLICILEVHQGEKIADLTEIAIRRTLLQEDIVQL